MMCGRTGVRRVDRRVPGSRALWAGAAWTLLIPVLTGCTHLGPAETELLREAGRLYGRGDLGAASARLDRLIAEHDGAAEIGEAYYLRGLCRAKARQFGPAARDFEAAVKKSQRDDLTLLAQVSLASLAFQRGDYDTAARYYQRVLPDLPAKPPKDEVLYSAGLSLQRVGQWKEATLCFAEILSRFRDRPIAEQARRRAAWAHPYFSIQLGAYRDLANANRAVQTWRDRNLDATQENLPLRGQAMWVVMAGRYHTHAEAVQALQHVRKLEPGACVIP